MDNLRDIQMIELEILFELDRICKKNNIQYFLLAGTVLGAIRHNGFIPWDDDIDIGMTRNQYERFIKICSEELDSNYFLQTYKTDPNYPGLYAKIRKNNTTFIEKATAKIDMHKGIYIDIFPFDNIPDRILDRFIHKWLLFVIDIIRSSRILEYHSNLTYIKKMIITIIHYFSRIVPKRLIDCLEEKLAKIYNRTNTECIGNLYGYGQLFKEYDTKICIKREYIFPLSKVKFECHYFPAPGRWHEYLTHYYNNYMEMPPEEQRIGHAVLIADTKKSYEDYNQQLMLC